MMKNNSRDDITSILDLELVDDDTELGGIAFIGETVRDFLNETNEEIHDMETLNKALISCGIRPICLSDYYVIEDELDNRYYDWGYDDIVNSIINNGLDCKVYVFHNIYEELSEYEIVQLIENMEWELLESYHA